MSLIKYASMIIDFFNGDVISGLLFLRPIQRHVDVFFVLEVGVGFAGIAGFGVAFAGEAEGASGLPPVGGFFVTTGDGPQLMSL